MNNNKLFSILIHLLIWALLIFLLRNSYLVWGWTIGKGYDTLWVHIYGALTNATIFYATSFYLIPKLFNKNLKRQFFIQSFIFLFIISIVELFFDYHIGAHYQNRFYRGALELETWNFFIEGFLYIIPVNILYYFISFAYRGPIDRNEMYERELILQREKLETELQLLKSQIHPHTLFNGMSSIYHSIDATPDKAKSLVLNLSNALRYHLYESSSKLSLLSKELEYLREYISLNQARIEDDAIIAIDFEDFEGNLLVTPLLLTPFVENAFKHLSQFPNKAQNKISIQTSIKEQDLHFHCWNTVNKEMMKKEKKGGIGLKNVKSRLDLIYGDKYELDIKDGSDKFIVRLKIPLEEKL